MTPKYKKSLFIFRRDLRLDDNIGLIQALHQSETVVPCFIFDPRQVGDENEYRATNCIQFMIESLQDLDEQLHKKDGKLYLFYGIADEVVEKLIKTEKIDAVFTNRDYTPFSIKRDAKIAKICHAHDCAFEQYDDALLNAPEDVKTKTGTPYSVFTPFFKHCSSTFKVPTPQHAKHFPLYTKTIELAEPKKIYTDVLPTKNPNLHVHGGTSEAKKLIRSIKKLAQYKETRDLPYLSTSNLSAHNKFGTVSIRELYHSIADDLGKNSVLIAQLYWRDFFYHVAFHNPRVFGGAFQEKYDALTWSKSTKNFQAWCTGTTGFPIVDAGMRQLNETGYMHNRTRMIVASFLTKDLHIDWQWGEKYFAQQLIDYDPCVNNGSWQWAASTGCDAQPYFRIFNPWLQQKKFDPECTYIKTWIPELKNTDIHTIHNWFNPLYRGHSTKYPAPMVDHKTEAELTIKWFKSV